MHDNAHCSLRHCTSYPVINRRDVTKRCRAREEIPCSVYGRSGLAPTPDHRRERGRHAAPSESMKRLTLEVRGEALARQAGRTGTDSEARAYQWSNLADWTNCHGAAMRIICKKEGCNTVLRADTTLGPMPGEPYLEG